MYCQSCGNKLKKGIRICPNCGHDNKFAKIQSNGKKILLIIIGILFFIMLSAYLSVYIGYIKLPKNIESKLQEFRILPQYIGNDLISGSIKTREGGARNLEAYIKDSRDGKKYRIVKMPDGNWWMAGNLDFINGLQQETRFKAKDKFGEFYSIKDIKSNDKDFICQKNSDGTCIESKVSYRFSNLIVNLCPEGWAIPSNEDWANMLNIIEKDENGMQNHIYETDTLEELNKGSIQKAGYLLKSTSDNWDFSFDGNKPLDKYGFSVKQTLTSRYNFNESYKLFGYNYMEDGYSPFWTSTEKGFDAYARVIYPNFNFVGNSTFNKYSFFPVRCIKK